MLDPDFDAFTWSLSRTKVSSESVSRICAGTKEIRLLLRGSVQLHPHSSGVSQRNDLWVQTAESLATGSVCLWFWEL